MNSYFRPYTGIRRPRHVLLWVVPTASYNSQEHNIFTFDTFFIGANNRYFSKAQLEVNNSIYYPQLEMTSDEESRLYPVLKLKQKTDKTKQIRYSQVLLVYWHNRLFGTISAKTLITDFNSLSTHFYNGSKHTDSANH